MKCDICGLAWDSVRMLHHNDTPVIQVCIDCITDGYSIHELRYADGGEWYVEDDTTGEIISGTFPTKAEAHTFIARLRTSQGDTE